MPPSDSSVIHHHTVSLKVATVVYSVLRMEGRNTHMALPDGQCLRIDMPGKPPAPDMLTATYEDGEDGAQMRTNTMIMRIMSMRWRQLR